MIFENIRRIFTTLFLVLTGVVALAACSDSNDPNFTLTDPNMPVFSGTYKSDFEQAWTESESEFVRKVIADQEISDAEWAELVTRITECFAREGLTFKGFLPNGGYEVDTGSLSGEDANAILPVCETESGETWFNYLRHQMNSNPENIPLEELLTACLIRNNVVPDSYTAENYLEDAPKRSFPYLDPRTGDENLRACSANPDINLNAP